MTMGTRNRISFSNLPTVVQEFKATVFGKLACLSDLKSAIVSNLWIITKMSSEKMVSPSGCESCLPAWSESGDGWNKVRKTAYLRTIWKLLKDQGNRKACREEETSHLLTSVFFCDLPFVSFSWAQDVSVVLVCVEERAIVTAATGLSLNAHHYTFRMWSKKVIWQCGKLFAHQ